MKNSKNGTYGYVYEIIYNYNKYCIKKYKLPVFNLGTFEDIIRDIFHYSSYYSNINLESIHDFPYKIMMECFNGDILDLILNNECTMNIDYFKIFFHDIVLQLYSIHSHGFLHSDIKLSNILYKNNQKYSICDYGLTEYYGFPLMIKKYHCTEGFKAPKSFSRYSINLDMYSLGATLFYFITGLNTNYLNEIKEEDIDKYSLVINKYIDPILLKNIIINGYSSKKIIYSSLTIDIKPNKSWLYISNYISSLFPINIIKNKYNSEMSVFKSLKIKNNRYYEYKYYEIYEKKYELEFLDDIYSTYCNHILQVSELNENQILLKNYILRYYFKSGFHIETLLFSFYLVNHFPINNNVKIESAKLFLNISSKILENNTLIKTVIDKNDIINFENNIMNAFFNHEIIFTPSIFFIYYFLYNIAYNYPLIYINSLVNLESISLSLMIIFLFKPITYMEQINYSKLSSDIIILSIEFILNFEIHNPLFDIIINNSKLINPEMLKLLIEDTDLYEYISLHI
jgi:serine/threonine protein kinase